MGSAMVKKVRDGLGALLAVCLAVRVGAWLVRPAVPLVAVLLVMFGLYVWIIGRGRL